MVAPTPAWCRRVLVCALLFVAALPLLAVDRNAFTFTKYDLRMTVVPDQSIVDVTGTISLRNTSKIPQRDIPLQISSSLDWRAVSINNEPAQWLSQPYTSDIDHTGQLSEAIVHLASDLAPGASLQLGIHYTGTVVRDATRLTRIGTPENVATRSDWDQIGRDFTAIRGLGYVTWYPVSIDAVSLSNGTEVWDAIADWKSRNGNAAFTVAITGRSSSRIVPICEMHGAINVTKESSGGDTLTSCTSTVADVPVLTSALQSLDRPQSKLTVLHTADHTQIARDYALAFESALVTTREWFGEPSSRATIVELTDAEALHYAQGSRLFTPLKTTPAVALQVGLARAAVHASFDSPRPWIIEGLSTFAQALVRETQQGRKAGLAYLNQFTNALATAEAQTKVPITSNLAPNESSSKPSLPGIPPQPLVATNDEVFFRTKAAFVWWMLRDLVGDDALKTAISRYKPEDDRDPSYMQRLLENATAPKRDLEAFFDTWIYRDRGIADLRIDSVNTRELLSSAGAPTSYMVAVTVENLSDVWVEAPVVARTTATKGSAGERVARVAVGPHQKAVARIPFPTAPTQVVVNDGSIPESELEGNLKNLAPPASK